MDSLARTAALQADVASWESTRPWEATRDELVAGRHPGIRPGAARGSEVASCNPDGSIIVKDEWFALGADTRRAVLYHEAGHGIGLVIDGGRIAEVAGLDSPLDVIDLPGARGLGGNYDEVIAEGYAALWSDPAWFDRAPEIRSLVVKLAREARLPVPPGVTAAHRRLGAEAAFYRGLVERYGRGLADEVIELLEEI